MAYLADPGGNFNTDAHRRVLAHLPVPDDSPTTETSVLVRLHEDPHTPVNSAEELSEVLSDLESDDLATQVGGDWRQTESGFDLLTGPNADDLDT